MDMRNVKLSIDEYGNIRVSGISNYRILSRYSSLSSALDSLPSDGGAVIVEPGTWNIDDTPIELSSNQSIIGFGSSSVLHNTDSTYTEKHTISAVGESGSELSGINIKGIKLTGVAGGGHGIHFEYVDEFTIDNVFIDGIGDSGIYLSNCDNGMVSSFDIRDVNSGYGIELSDSDGNRFINGLVDGNGISLSNSVGNIFSSVISKNCSDDGWILKSGSNYNVINGCRATGNTGYGIKIESGALYNLIVAGINALLGNTAGPVSDSGSSTEWIRGTYDRAIVAWDETEVDYTDTSGDTYSEEKTHRIITSDSYGYKVSTIYIIAEMKVDAGTGTLGVFIDGGANPSLTLTTTSTSYELKHGSFDVSWSDDTIHTVSIKLKNSDAGNTTSNRTYECYVS